MQTKKQPHLETKCGCFDGFRKKGTASLLKLAKLDVLEFGPHRFAGVQLQSDHA